jgi:hypothetical protein
MPILRTRDRSSESQYNNFKLRPVSVLDAWRSAPSYRTAASFSTTGVFNVSWPSATEPGDLGILVVEVSGDESYSTPDGWTKVPGSPVVDIADVTGSSLNVFYAYADSARENFPIPGATDHKRTTLLVFSGASIPRTSSTDTKTIESTSLTFPDYTAPSRNNRIVFIASHPLDTTSTQFSSFSNSNLTGISEHVDGGVTTGNGGGFCVYSGVVTDIGPIGTSTVSIATSCTNACMVFALEPSLAYPA